MNEVTLRTYKDLSLKIQADENKKIEKNLDIELSSAQKSMLASDSELGMYYNELNAQGNTGTLADWTNFIAAKKLEDKTISIEKNLDQYNNQSNAVLLLGLVPTFKNQVKSIKGVKNFLNWVSFINTNNFHAQNKDIDDIFVNSTEILLEKISIIYPAKKAVKDIENILDLTGKNCSQNFLQTIHKELHKIKDSGNLKNEDKEKLYKTCLSSLRNAIYIANDTKIFSSFLFEEYHLFKLIEEMGKTADDFGQSDLNSIIDSLFSIYFYTIENFGVALTEDKKMEIFNALIPYDNTSKRELFIEKISNKILSENENDFSKHFACKILEKILMEDIPDNRKNKDAKLKCVKLISGLYAQNCEKNEELNSYIKECLGMDGNKAAQSDEINRVLIRNLISVYKNNVIDIQIRDNLYTLFSDIFPSCLKLFEQIKVNEEIIDLLLSRPENPKTLSTIEYFLKAAYIDTDEKKRVFIFLNNQFPQYNTAGQKLIIQVITKNISESKDSKNKELYLDVCGILSKAVIDNEILTSSEKKNVVFFLIDLFLLFENRKSELTDYLRNIIKELDDNELKSFIFETLLEKSDENIEILYPLLEFSYLNYTSLIKNSPLLFKFLQFFVEQLNNQNNFIEARKILTEYLKSDDLIENKKQFLDSLENEEKYKLLSAVQKNMLYEIIQDCLDSNEDTRLVDEFYNTVVEHFLPYELEQKKSDESFIFRIGTDEENINRTKRWFKIILDSPNATEEHEEILRLIKQILLRGINDIRKDYLDLLKECQIYKNDKKKLLNFSLEVYNELIKLQCS